MDVNSQESRLAELLIDEALMDRMVKAVEMVRERLCRSTRALEIAKVPYAVADDNAVATWVARADESAVRNTPDVDILLRRSDLEAADVALSAYGFVRRVVNGTQIFMDGATAGRLDAIHIIFANEKVRVDDIWPTPDVSESEPRQGFRVLKLEPLITMLLVSFRSKDRMHLRDLIDVGLVDEKWLARLPAELSRRLEEVLEDPDG